MTINGCHTRSRSGWRAVLQTAVSVVAIMTFAIWPQTAVCSETQPAARASATANQSTPASFRLEVLPILTKAGCNAGACHGKGAGRNGFKLSLLGFDPQFDFDALTKEARGRRLFSPDPDRSLLLQKVSARLPHGGGRRLPPDSDGYRILRRWITAGMPRRQPQTPKLVGVSVEPSDRVLGQRASQK